MIPEATELYDFLEAKYNQFNRPDFIETDPISIPHRFTRKEDIEIAGFLTATISWGNRSSIMKDASKLMEWMENSPADFLLHADEKDFKVFQSFYHRTFNGGDCLFFLYSLRNLCQNFGGLELLFESTNRNGLKDGITQFREQFLSVDHELRSEKHLANPMSGSAGKRLLMFLRWMVRDDKRGVDFGLWKSIDPSKLMCPLDVHSGTVARKLGLLHRKQNDWKAVEELTENLRKFDPTDPVKYDFALFGLGVFERF
jgi:uncharacterized protein (TIGR02757 family)